jgi:hypothetical protein
MPAAATQERTEFFIQLADPQFGAFSQDKDFAQETANYEFAVANVNRLRPGLRRDLRRFDQQNRR